jgi:hypothetical protein
MPRLGLWWVKWNGSDYESRMTVGSRKATVGDFRERGFDRIVVLSGEGRGIKYSGPFYNSGYNDGREFARWVLNRIYGTPVYITIPFSRPEGFPRDQVQIPFEYSGVNSYYKGWIDGVLSVDNSDLRGFYWSYESCLQTTSYDEAHVTKEFIQYMSDYIHDHGQELIWIPTIGNRTMDQVRTFCAIPTLAGYFDHVFVQPHYYQTTKLSDGSDYTFQELVRRVEWMANNGFSIEMEADNSIIGEKSNCAYCKSTQNREGCDETPTPETEEKCINRACDYYKAILEVSPSAFSTRAYYFGTDLRVVDKVRSKCPNW